MLKISATFALVMFLSAFALSADPKCGDPSNPKDLELVKALPACSYTTTNKSCQVTIDRMNPSTPPTIYVRRRDKHACSVYVVADNLYPLEHLTLDWKSSTIVVPPDVFQRVVGAVSPTLGSLTVVGAAGGRAPLICEKLPAGCTTARNIYEAQERLKAKLPDIHPYPDIKPQIEEIKKALLPPPGGPHPGKPWENTAEWRDTTHAALKREVDLIQGIKDIQAKLTANTATLQTNASTAAEKADVEKLLTNQKMLDDYIKVLDVPAAKIKALDDGLESIDLAANGADFIGVITDTAPNDKNYQLETWVLNYSNQLLPIAKRAAADTLKPEDEFNFGGMANASDKQPVVTLTVQFQATSAIELSTGLMVPFTPYHSYAKGSDASGNAIVQETTTYVVVPMAFVNYRVAEWPTRKQVSAFFFTGGVGVNSSTKAVEFSAGATYSYRSFAVSMLFDIGRDTQLGGGLTPGGSLGKYSVPPTTTTWGAKPAAAVSIRIPLGGGSSTGK